MTERDTSDAQPHHLCKCGHVLAVHDGVCNYGDSCGCGGFVLRPAAHDVAEEIREQINSLSDNHEAWSVAERGTCIRGLQGLAANLRVPK